LSALAMTHYPRERAFTADGGTPRYSAFPRLV
jgi:hypothetical protein